MRWVLILTVAVMVAGCPAREPPAPPSPVPDLLRTADGLWARRGEVGLQAVDEALQEAFQAEPRNPEVMWRLVRLAVTRGLTETDPRAAEYDFAEGRTIGLQCLDIEPVFPQRRAEYGWEQALEGLGPAYTACAAWMALAWARWIRSHGGAAAAIDYPRVDALLQHAVATGGRGTRLPTLWARGLLAAVRPPWEGQDLDQAEILLGRAGGAADEDLPQHLDLVELVLLPRGERDRARSELQGIVAEPARTPEGAAAQAQAQALLDALGSAVQPGPG